MKGSAGSFPAGLPLLALSLLSGCASLGAAPQLESVSYSLHGAGNDWYAARSIAMDGTVHGLHASGSRSGPIVSESKETARPEDIAELRALARQLPSPATLPPPADRANAAYSELDVQFADGTVRQFYLPGDKPFADPALGRIEAIVRSYRAGYW